jgi:endoglucanase
MTIKHKMTFGSLTAALVLAFVACQNPSADANKPATESVIGPAPIGPAPIGPAPTVATPDATSSLNASAKQWVWWRGVNLAGADFAESEIPGAVGVHYQYPNQAEVDYFSKKGMNIFRLPFLWERLQPSLNGEFDSAEIARIDLFVNQTTAKGKIVILDPHNYARYGKGRTAVAEDTSGGKYLIGSSGVPYAAFNDLWKRLALRYKANNKVVFGLMNEPYDMPTANWVKAANGAIAAIRGVQASNLILVPGNRFSGAWSWTFSDKDGASNAEAMLQIKDPYNWSWFEVHQYLDKYSSGTEDVCDNSVIGTEPLKNFTKWLRDNGKKGFLGEFASPQNAKCDKALEDLVGYMENNGDVWRGWTYWAAGPFWPAGESLEPNNGVDARQIPILKKFLP